MVQPDEIPPKYGLSTQNKSNTMRLEFQITGGTSSFSLMRNKGQDVFSSHRNSCNKLLGTLYTVLWYDH